MELSVGGGPKESLWQTFYFKLEPSRLVYYPQSTFSSDSPSPPRRGEEAEEEKGSDIVGVEPAGQFLLEEILSVNSRGQLCEIELRDNRDNLHFLRASSKYSCFPFSFSNFLTFFWFILMLTDFYF